MNKLPTYEECLNIVKNNDAFYMKETSVDNTPIYIFCYRLASFNDFEDFNAYELRGLSFVKENNEYKRYLALNKFFNVNQNEGWMENDLKDKKIIKMEDKLDGSMISFILVNDKVIAKTKMDLTSPQAIAVNEMLNNNQDLYNFIYNCLNSNIMPICEYISPFNQIVLQYPKSDLILLQLRNQLDGSYINFDNVSDIEKKNNNTVIKVRKSMPPLTLQEVLNMKETETKIEGWVLTFDDGQMAKVKTEWYLNLHGLIGYNVLADNILIKTIIEDNIDDVLAELNKDSEKRKYIENMMKIIYNYYDSKIKHIEALRQFYYEIFEEDKKKFSLEYSKDPLFGIVVKSFRDKEVIPKLLKEYILKKTYRLNESKKFVNKIK